jgi:DNA-binding MltR family transcriptional regulator
MAKSKSHTATQVAEFLEELKSQTDRGTAIIAAAVLDDLLNQLLTARLLNLGSDRHDSLFDGANAPLSSFSAKIEMCFAVGVISNSARLAMHLIREVRNEFAHRIEQIAFDHPTVANMVQTRILSELKKPGRSNRDLFIDSFTAVSFIIYGTLVAGDLRIKPLEETHQQYFLEILSNYSEVLKEAIREVQAEDQNPSPTPK